MSSRLHGNEFPIRQDYLTDEPHAISDGSAYQNVKLFLSKSLIERYYGQPEDKKN